MPRGVVVRPTFRREPAFCMWPDAIVLTTRLSNDKKRVAPMSWLFVAQIRPFVLLAGAASLLLNLALLMPSIYMMQVFDRVFSSRSLETLAMLSAIAFLALGLGYCMDIVRS